MGNGRSCGQSQDPYGTDEACLTFFTRDNGSFSIFSQSTECQGCDLIQIQSGAINGSSLIVDAKYGTILHLESKTIDCRQTFYFTDDGHYGFNVKECEIITIDKPMSPYIPILIAVIYFILILSIHSRKKIWNYLRSIRQNDGSNSLLSDQDAPDVRPDDLNQSSSEAPAPETKSPKKRVTSLDAFRGLSVAIMVFVNYGGGGYYFFNHSVWNGLTVADLVFPWFMWIMGVSMPIAIQSQLKRVSRLRVLGRVIRRSILLFALGIMINSIGDGNNNFRTLRIPGVLQRFGVSYLLAGSVTALTFPVEMPTGSEGTESSIGRFFSSLRDIFISLPQLVLAVVLITIHSTITFTLEVPGCPTGYLGPGGLHEGGKYFNCTGGSAGYIDKVVFGREHIYNSPTSKQIYQSTEPYDPEGLLGCLTATGIVCIGIQAGIILLTYKDWLSRVKRFVTWSLIFGIIAGGLCEFSKDGGLIPVNKNLWSLSFIFTMSSMAFVLLTLMFILIDVLEVWTGKPFLYVGMNPILVYLGHEICHGIIPFGWTPISSSHYELLTMNLWGAYLWIFIAFQLYKRKIFFSV